MPSMFHSTNDAAHRKHVDSRPTDDYQYPCVRERSRKSLPSSPTSIPSPSLRSSVSRHPDIHDNTPGRILSSRRNPSSQSSPVTPPSSTHGGSSRFADSQSSLTSGSAGVDVSRSGCEDGNRVPTMMRPPNFGTPPSPVSGRSRSIAESDLRFPTMYGSTHTPMSPYPTSSPRPRTAPHSPSPPVTTEARDSHVSMAIKFLLSKPALPLPTRLSRHCPSASEALPPSPHAVSRKSRSHPIELDVSATPFLPGYAHLDQTEVPFASQGIPQSPSGSSTPIRGREQKPRNVLRRKPSARAKEKERMEREIEKKHTETVSHSSSAHRFVSMSVSTPIHPLSGHSRDRSMTPGGTGAREYEPREDSFEQLAEPHAAVESVPSSPVPYYTVYGTRSEHRVTAGGPHDTRESLLHDHILACQRAQTFQEEPSRSLARKGSLTKMVSSRWKKATGGISNIDESRPPSRGHSKSRSSLQERHPSRDRREPLHAREFGTELYQTRSVTEPRGDLKESPVEGSKIWKLVKRISTGGMRERFIADKAAPPVPSIPKELLNSPPPQPQALRDGSRKFYSPPTPENITNSGPRPSMATSSPSPNSSDVASVYFFQKSHSRRSSVSSFGEGTASLSGFPRIAQGEQHVASPQEPHQIASDQKKDQDSISSSRSCSHSGLSKVNSHDQRPHVVPPVDDPWEMFPRTMPTSSATQLSSLRTHKLGVRPPTAPHVQLLPDGNVSLSPPPRPARSAMRSSKGKGSPLHSRPATADGKLASQTSFRVSSTASEKSTITLQPPSNSLACMSEGARDSSHNHSRINFRELESTPRRAPLTEREKAEIWDNLLERSAQAGGTLHLGASGQLESDTLRYSSCSDVSRS